MNLYERYHDWRIRRSYLPRSRMEKTIPTPEALRRRVHGSAPVSTLAARAPFCRKPPSQGPPARCPPELPLHHRKRR